MNAPIRYTLLATAPHTHRFLSRCTVAEPAADGQCFVLPAWIPGSYLIREFAKNVIAFTACDGDGAPVAVTKTGKDGWRCAPCRGPLSVELEVHALDLSVRTAWLDTTRAYANGTALFPRLPDRADAPCELELVLPQGETYAGWRVATGLTALATDARGAGLYAAADYDELVDCPIEIGDWQHARFTACGVPHEIVIAGRCTVDLDRLARDLERVCSAQIRLFGEPAPFERYLFLVMAVGDGYGGLEHRNSTSLLCARDDLPQPGAAELTDGYRTFLGLCSHEYFHAWNVKRIRPAAFTPYDYQRENYTRLLWAFEGITSYYDDLMLRRSGLIDEAAWLQLLGETATRVWRGPGRHRQSVAESSFDAWTKFYRPDADTPNAVVSYYAKGALVALALDLTLRRLSRGTRSLDDLMRALWQRYGRPGLGVPEDGIESLAAELAGQPLADFFAACVHGTGDLPLAELLAGHGLVFRLRPAEGATDKGGRAGSGPGGRVDAGLRTTLAGEELRVAHVLDGGPAQAAGLAAGDVLVALDGLRVQPRGFERQLGRYAPGARVELLGFRRDELMRFPLELAAAPADTVWITPDPQADAEALQRRQAWLGETGVSPG
ncbi:MAG: M61 family metallopeptidase [Proteobacteria bacterium]|nr:M61 family metallopeptidase [Pseudomonadota bacterium]